MLISAEWLIDSRRSGNWMLDTGYWILDAGFFNEQPSRLDSRLR